MHILVCETDWCYPLLQECAVWELWEGVERLRLLAGEEKGSGGGLKTEYISLLSKLVGVV